MALVGCAPTAPRQLEKCGSTLQPGLVQSRCYELADAEFRGVHWPTTKGGPFSVSVVSSRREYDFEIPGPAFAWGRDVRDVRPATEVPDKDNSGFDVHSIGTPGGTLFTVRLPHAEMPYIYQIHREQTAEALTFMNPAEGVFQRGIFGYVIARNSAP